MTRTNNAATSHADPTTAIVVCVHDSGAAAASLNVRASIVQAPSPTVRPMQRAIDELPSLIGVKIGEQRVRDFPLHLSDGFVRPMLRELGEQSPSLPVSRQIIKGKVGGNRFQPTARRRAAAQVREVLVC